MDEMVLAVLPEADLNKVAVLPFVGGALKGFEGPSLSIGLGGGRVICVREPVVGAVDSP